LKGAIDAADGGKRDWLARRVSRVALTVSVEHARSPADDLVLARMEAS